MATTITSYAKWLVLSAVVIYLDWLTKHWASANLELFTPQVLTDWLNLHLAHNRGAAFSLFSEAGGWQRWFLTTISAVVSVILLVWLWKTPAGGWRQSLSLSLVLGGAIGNLIDRVQLGYVVDFIDFHYRGSHFPAFNLADSAITLGMMLLIIDSIWPSHMRHGDVNSTQNKSSKAESSAE